MTETNLMIKAVFWDMDGTLIDSEPYWHEGEMKIAAAHGGYWDEELAWQGSGTPVPDVAVAWWSMVASCRLKRSARA